jgi:hypothetical protein
VRFSADVAYLAPGATLPCVETAEIERKSALPVSADPLAPAVTPVQSPRIGDVDAFGDLTGVGETPTVSWTAPSVGTPTAYVVEVSRLDAAGGVTSATPVLRHTTAQLKVTVPPGILVAGATYFARVTALVSTVPITAPYRGASVLSRASALTGTFTR